VGIRGVAQTFCSCTKFRFLSIEAAVAGVERNINSLPKRHHGTGNSNCDKTWAYCSFPANSRSVAFKTSLWGWPRGGVGHNQYEKELSNEKATSRKIAVLCI
jgi:hypothetical protein